MTYVYDILVNFKKELYEFYEWNKSDEIIHIRKIPIIKIDSNDLYNIRNNDVLIDLEFLEKVKNKTEFFLAKSVKNIEYSCLLCDDNTVLAIRQKENVLYKSTLLLDEELDALEEINYLKEKDIKYKILKKNTNNEFKTKKELAREKFIKKELSKINDNEKLKYIYFECFNKKEEKEENIMYKLKNSINDKSVNEKLYNFFKLTS